MKAGELSVPLTNHKVLPITTQQSPTPTVASVPSPRFVFVDGLRGLAALAIVVFHIWWYEPAPYPAFESCHWIVDAAFLRFRAGVQVLLVISGFVIAHTLRHIWVTPREILWFIARRLVRLIPPYWLTIGIIIVLDRICRQFWDLPSPFDGHLSVPRISAHMTFLQDILGHEALGAGMWTLCIEMQFYMMAIVAWGMAQHLALRPVLSEPRPSVLGLILIFAPCAIASLFYWRPLESASPWVVHFFWMFFLGMATWWTLDRTVPQWIYFMIITFATIELIFGQLIFEIIASNDNIEFAFGSDWWYENSIALSTAVTIFFVGRLGRLQTWLNWNWLQHLGRISYSLYLIHFPICHLVMSTGWTVFGDSPTSVQAVLIMLGSVFASLVAANTLYLVIEVPSNRWAASLKHLQMRKTLLKTNVSISA